MYCNYILKLIKLLLYLTCFYQLFQLLINYLNYDYTINIGGISKVIDVSYSLCFKHGDSLDIGCKYQAKIGSSAREFLCSQIYNIYSQNKHGRFCLSYIINTTLVRGQISNDHLMQFRSDHQVQLIIQPPG